MKILKTIITLLLLTVSYTVSAQTEQQSQYLVLTLNDGQEILFLLSHNPRISHSEKQIDILDDGTSISYPLSSVYKYSMREDTQTKVREISEDGSISLNSGDIVVTGFAAGMPINVINIDGTAVMRSYTNSEGMQTIHMSQYPAGIYIINVGNQTFKFTRR